MIIESGKGNFMRKIKVLLLAAILAVSFAGCGREQTNGVMEAWVGAYSEEKFVNVTKEYQTKHDPIAAEGENKITSVSFRTDFEIASCAVTKTSAVDPQNATFEQRGAIYLAVKTSFDGKTVTVSTDWWYDGDDWTADYPIWSYLVCVKDTDGAEHYYYFRTDYGAAD